MTDLKGVLDPNNEVIKTLLKLSPQQGDVLVLQLDRSYPMETLWDQLEHFRKIAGIQILTVTDDMVIYPINENGNYALLDRSDRLSDEHKKRLIIDWAEKFPNSKLAILPGTIDDLTETGDYWPSQPKPAEPADGVDIL